MPEFAHASPYLTAEVHDGAFGVDVLLGIVPKRGHTGEVRRELDMLLLREHEEGALRPERTQEEPELQQDIVPRDRVRLGTGYNGIVGEEEEQPEVAVADLLQKCLEGSEPAREGPPIPWNGSRPSGAGELTANLMLAPPFPARRSDERL